MRIIRKHNMTQDAAKAKVDNLVSGLMQQFGDSVSNLKYAWQGYVFGFSGRKAIFHIRGTLEVSHVEMILDVDGIPFFQQGQRKAQLKDWFDENWAA